MFRSGGYGQLICDGPVTGVDCYGRVSGRSTGPSNGKGQWRDAAVDHGERRD